MRVKFKFFKSGFSTWDMMFQEAADFASQLPKDRLINISHSADGNVGVVTVWYWGDGEPATEETDSEEIASEATASEETDSEKTASETELDWLRQEFERSDEK
jgi:hypothetical protein